MAQGVTTPLTNGYQSSDIFSGENGLNKNAQIIFWTLSQMLIYQDKPASSQITKTIEII